MNMLPNTMRPLPSMKESLSHIKDEQEPWGQSGMNPGAVNQQQQIIQQQRQGYSLYSPDSVSAVNRCVSSSGYTSDTMTTSASVTSTNDLYNLGPPQQQQQQQHFNYHGHYNMTEYSNGGNGMYMMYNQMQPHGVPRGYHGHHSDIYGHSETGGSVKDELDQLSVATGDLDEGLSETAGTPATPTDSLEGPPTPIVHNGGQGGPTPVPTPVSNSSNSQGEYRCTECNKVFNRLCYLKQHNKSFHNGEKPFKCVQCGKRFPVEVLYQEHLAKHAGDKPYKCEVCPKQFNHKTDLRRHMCLHTGEKPFTCDVCGKGFIREDRMVKHADTHKKKAAHVAGGLM